MRHPYLGIPVMAISDEHKSLASALAMAVAPADPEFFRDVLALHIRSYLSSIKVPTPVNSIEFEMLRGEAARMKGQLQDEQRR